MPQKRRWPWEAQQVLSRRQQEKSLQEAKRQRWWKIYLPVGMSALVAFAVAATLTWQGSSDTVAHVADAVVIFGALGCMVGGLLVFGLLVGLTVLTLYAQRRTPQLAQTILQRLIGTQYRLVLFTDKLLRPMVSTRSRLAGWRALWRSLRRGGHTHG